MVIIAAAIKFEDVIYTLPAPNRHSDIILYMADVIGLEPPITGTQGFLDDARGFVGRKEAGEIAVAGGQIKELRWPDKLFSEDLW